MDEKQLQEIRARVEKATPGPWWNESNVVHCNFDVVGHPHICHVYYTGDDYFNDDDRFANGDFLGEARTDIPDLLAEVEAQRKALEEIRNYSTGSLGPNGVDLWDAINAISVRADLALIDPLSDLHQLPTFEQPNE